MRNIYDGAQILLSAVDLLFEVVKILAPKEFDFAIETIEHGLKIALLCCFEKYEEAIVEFMHILENDPNKEPLDNLVRDTFSTITLYESFAELINSIQAQPKYMSSTIDYCVNEVNFIVFVQPDSGTTTYKLIDINNAILAIT